MQRSQEVSVFEWWYDPTDEELSDAFEKLKSKKEFGTLLKKLHRPVEQLSLVLVPVTMAITAIASQISHALSWVVGITAAVYIVGGMLPILINDRQIKNFEASMRRGAFGSAVMWEPDAEWAMLECALPRHLKLKTVMAWHNPEIDRIIAHYLTSTSDERRVFRNSSWQPIKHPAHATLHTAAFNAGQAICDASQSRSS